MISSKEQARLNLITAIRLISKSVDLNRLSLKTENYYDKALSKAVRDFYNGNIDAGQFIDKQISLIEGQFQRAWNEGMRNVGVDPKDMTDAWRGILQDRITKEQDYILNFAQAIEDAAKNGDPIDPLLNRVDLWVAKYPEVERLAEVTCGGNTKLKWVLGPTEQHCTDCAQYDGTILTADEWGALGVHPQGDMLECGGWNCLCEFIVTEEPAGYDYEY